MKLSYIALSKIPSREANSVHVMKMCQALSKAGCDTNLIVPMIPAQDEDPYRFYGVDCCFKISHVIWKKTLGSVFLFSYRILKLLRAQNAQCVYGRHLTSCAFAAFAGFRTVWESHTPVEYMGSIYSFIFRMMITRKHFVKLVVISSSLKKYYIEKYGMNPNDIEVMADCSDVVDIANIKVLNLDDVGYKANVGYIGQLYPGKGMEIISAIVPLCPDVLCHIIGGKEADIKVWKKKLSDCKNVVFHGFVKPSETSTYGLSMDILIAPYLKKVQGAGAKNDKKNLAAWMSPLKIFEYMSYKKPIITSELPVLHDVLNESNSIMCNPEVVEEWVSAINYLVENKIKSEELADAAYSDFINNYTWDIRAKRIIDLYC